jgi:hypothetical protein
VKAFYLTGHLGKLSSCSTCNRHPPHIAWLPPRLDRVLPVSETSDRFVPPAQDTHTRPKRNLTSCLETEPKTAAEPKVAVDPGRTAAGFGEVLRR